MLSTEYGPCVCLRPPTLFLILKLFHGHRRCPRSSTRYSTLGVFPATKRQDSDPIDGGVILEEFLTDFSGSRGPSGCHSHHLQQPPPPQQLLPPSTTSTTTIDTIVSSTPPSEPSSRHHDSLHQCATCVARFTCIICISCLAMSQPPFLHRCGRVTASPQNRRRNKVANRGDTRG
ncbi:hypothetical protein BGZ61DRAFT_186580 [Ilyonectria robusta]|uniref:uncharacterized protein n=1 Tax=Ilyonectria robusta TaxID=1079257 RepID=UPI001E8D2C72|nr:uncharacterized protein BGZ61DRAFT_186580 [Ilyonectria robusta]KAH8729723.1 hypothetical protein BGZ61DRAFT_186580 [Ilyonectria robusta]